MKVYLVMDNFDGRVKCCFLIKEKAEQYCKENTDFFFEEIDVIQ